jgi:predicted phage terminase large subunit-like protein
MVIKAQSGPQETFLKTNADIAIYGGAAGGGKTYALLLESLYHIDNPGFGSTIFRRTQPQITAEGGLVDTAMEIYPHVRGSFTYNPMRWKFPSGAKIEFRHLQHEKNILDWQGAQVPLIGYDELSHFSEKQFFYLLSRNRSTCGVRPYIRATTNPDPDSWVKQFISWWLDDEGRYADKKKSGKIRWLLRIGDEIKWFASEPAAKRHAAKVGLNDLLPKSVTFIPSSVYDNKILLELNPEYLANLMALSRVERERLLGGDWKIRAGAGDVLSKADFEIVDAAPISSYMVRCWDRAATEPSPTNRNPNWTAGVQMSRTGDIFYIHDVRRFRKKPNVVKARIKNTATQDGRKCIIVLYIDPGQAGVVEYYDYLALLIGWAVQSLRETKKKYDKWLPFIAQAQAGNVKLVRGDWNEPFLNEMEGISENEDDYDDDDQMDGAYGAFEYLTVHAGGKFGKHTSKKRPITAGVRERDY